MIHDPVLLDQPALLEAAGSAARLALENERLQAELRAQLEELRGSRSADRPGRRRATRRLERDLHGGDQQRLLGIGTDAAGVAVTGRRRRGGDGVSPPGGERASRRPARAAGARSRHPPGGPRGRRPRRGGPHAGAAHGRSGDRYANGERLPAHVESAAYFVVAEALANVTKHAHASSASVAIEQRDGLADDRAARRRRRRRASERQSDLEVRRPCRRADGSLRSRAGQARAHASSRRFHARRDRRRYGRAAAWRARLLTEATNTCPRGRCSEALIEPVAAPFGLANLDSDEPPPPSTTTRMAIAMRRVR